MNFASFKSCPREGASHLERQKRSICYSFKSCPREGASVFRRAFRRCAQTVSSHAPVRGHQGYSEDYPWRPVVSSHAPVRWHRRWVHRVDGMH